MKKKILLTLTVIISFIICVDNVQAASELTCVYPKYAGQVAVKIVQYQSGEKKVFVNTQESNPSADSEKWFFAQNVTFESDEELTECYEYMNYANGSGITKKVMFSNNYKAYFSKLIQEEKEVIDKHNVVRDEDYVSGEKSNMEDELASGKWIIGCQYKKINDDKYIYLYFNEEKVRVVNGEEVLPIYTGEKDSAVAPYNKYSDIQVSRLIKEYNSNGGCPINIYVNTMTTTLSLGQIVFSLDKLTDSKNMSTYVVINTGNSTEEPMPVDPENCSDLLGEDVISFINEIMKWIRIIVPILLMALGVLDFTKATFSKSEEDMKKSREKFIKRIVAAVLVFLVPVFVNLLLELANSVWSWINPETCIK